MFERRGGRLEDPATFGALARLSAIAELPGVGAVSSVENHMARALTELDGLPLATLRSRLLRSEAVSATELEQVTLLLRTSAPELFQPSGSRSRPKARHRRTTPARSVSRRL